MNAPAEVPGAPATVRPTPRVAGALAACVLAGLVLFPNLGGYTLWDPDEARHAEVAREMLAASDWRGWIVPAFNFQPYHDKPVLFYWAVAAVGTLRGVDEVAARVVPAIAALLTVLAVYLAAARVWDVAAGTCAAVALVTSVEFVGLGRYADLDMLLTLWITVGLLAVHRWTEEPEAGRWLGLAAATAGLGALSKGLVAPVLIGGIAAVHLAVTGRLRLLTWRRLAGALAVLLAVAAPWYVAAGLVDPAYLRDFLLHHHVARFFGESGEFHAKPFWFPSVMLVAGFFPWSPLLPAAVHGLLSRARRGALETLCACWILGVLVFFTLSRGKLGTYVLPAFPPLALLVGRYLAGLRARADLAPRERRLLAGGVAGIAIVCLAAAPVALAVTSRIYGGAWRTTSLLATAAIPLGLALPLLLRRRRWDLLPVAVGGGMLVLITLFYRWGAPQISAVVSEAPLARLIAARGTDETAPIIAYDVRTPSLLFYLHRPVQRLTRPAELTRVLASHPLVFVVSSPRHVPEILAAGQLYPWHTSGRHVLYASRPL
jgi:4-amino-4-deoxy-L-arabinose transferase-like glycosyltransferase